MQQLSSRLFIYFFLIFLAFIRFFPFDNFLFTVVKYKLNTIKLNKQKNKKKTENYC